MIRIRELPPLRHHVLVTTPTRRCYRWGSDEPNAANIPLGLRASSTMPGGFETFDGSLPRKPGTDYADLERLSTIQILGPGGFVIGEYRLERTPRVSGDQFAINPSAVGWQAHLADDESASFVGIDRDLGRWQGPSRQRQVNMIGLGRNPMGPTVMPDAATGAPALETGFDGSSGWDATSLPFVDAWYDAGEGNRIAQLKADWTRGQNVSGGADANWFWAAVLAADDVASSQSGATDLQAAGPGSIDVTTAGAWRWASVDLFYGAAFNPAAATNPHYAVYWTNVRVFGDHGLTIYGSTAAEEGLLASDIEAYAVRRWAPLLSFSEGSNGSIRPSTFVIPHLVFADQTNAGEMIKQAVRFELRDWAVWENKTYYSNDRGERGRRWRARIAPAQLEETGPQIDRLWESVVVQYRDVDGSTRTVGPPGSGAGTTDASLKDSDPENPANKLGIIRRQRLQAGTLTAASAIELGRRFLEYQKLLDSSGRARLVGHVMDDNGVMHPYWRVRAGDSISFVDAADWGYRRIVRAEHDFDQHTTTVDLDSPPDGMAALLERLGVVAAALGV